MTLEQRTLDRTVTVSRFLKTLEIRDQFNLREETRIALIELVVKIIGSCLTLETVVLQRLTESPEQGLQVAEAFCNS